MTAFSRYKTINESMPQMINLHLNQNQIDDLLLSSKKHEMDEHLMRNMTFPIDLNHLMVHSYLVKDDTTALL